MIDRIGVRAALLALAVLFALPSSAQEQPDSAAQLNLPSDLTVLAPTDPSVRKATAIVNGAIITDTDVDQRLALVAAANGGRIPEEERGRLRAQILSNLIDETLQIQEAKANKITIDSREIEQTYARVSSNFKRSPKDFAEYLRSQGSSEGSIKRQIEGELAWRRVLGRQIEPFVNVSDEEVNGLIGRLKASKGANEYRVGEIFISANPSNGADALANANRIIEQVRGGASFVAYARQYSEASTAAVGGDLGWVRAEQLPDELAQMVQTMAPGQISAPIALSGGYSIISLIDKRQVLTADARDAVLALKQLTVTFPPGTTQAQATPKVERFAAGAKTLQGCGKAADLAKEVGADVVDNDQVRVRDLPAQLQNIMLALRVGEATPPFGSVDEGVRVLVVCGRDDPVSSEGPSFDAIFRQLEEDRVNRRARRYLRDLRRDAVIDYR